MPREKKPIVVALTQDENDRELLDAAGFFGLRLDLPVHIVQSAFGRLTLSSPMLLGEDVQDFSAFITDSELAQAMEYATSMAERLPNQVMATVKVLTGSLVPSLISYARSVGAMLIACGDSPRQADRWFGAFSLPRLIVKNSPIPVLITSPDCVEVWKNEDLRITVADDLSSRAPLRFAVELLERAHYRAALTILHVNPMTLEDYSRRTLISANDRAYAPDAHAEFLDMDTETRTLLAKRIPRRVRRLVKPVIKVVHGDPDEQIRLALADAAPSVAMFGRHKAFHTHPFYVGRLPLAKMFSVRLPIMVVPA